MTTKTKTKPAEAPKVEEDKRHADLKPDFTAACEACGQKPIVPMTGLCGPCTFGEADTAGGNW